MVFTTKPKFVTFDMNGTLIKFAINDALRDVLGDRLPAEIAEDYLQACKAYRIDECMGDYKPFRQIVANSMERASRRVGIEYREADARAVYETVPTWGPYPGVTEALNRLAAEVPLVIITNTLVMSGVGVALWWIFRGRFDALGARIDRLDQRMDRLEASVDLLRSDLTAVALAVGARQGTRGR